MIPRDHISAFPSYWPSSMARMTSGAIQYGVPTKELAGHTMEAEPKSAEIFRGRIYVTVIGKPAKSCI